jgi:hypothetical protein
VITPDIEDTARLVLMEDPPPSGPVEFARRLRENASDSVDLHAISALWGRYRGYDGRTLPTHDIATGSRL